MSKGAVELREFECRQGGNKVSQFTLEHQGEEIAADRAGARQAVFRAQHHFGRESENFPVNGGADHGRHIVVFGNKGSGYYDVKAGLPSTLGNSLARSVNLASRAGLPRDERSGLPREALAVFSKDRAVFSLRCASSLPLHILAQRRADQRRAASASR